MGDGSLTELTPEEHIFLMKKEREKMLFRMRELDTWLATSGRRCVSKADSKVKREMAGEKTELVQKATLLKEKIQLAIKELADANAKKMVRVSEDRADVDKLVTEHALVRWLERKHGVDVSAMKADMYADMVRAKENGKAQVTVGGGVRVTAGDIMYVVDPLLGTIITCYQHSHDNDF